MFIKDSLQLSVNLLKNNRTLRRFFGLALFCLFFLLLLPMRGTHAHGSGGVQRLDFAPVGAYFLHAWTQPVPPRVGNVHVEVLVTDAEYQPVEHARVLVAAQPVAGDGEPLRAVAAPNTLAGAVVIPSVRQSAGQEASLPIAEAGEYTITITVLDVDGAGGEVSFPLRVSGLSGWLLVAIQVASTLLLFVAAWFVVGGVQAVRRRGMKFHAPTT